MIEAGNLFRVYWSDLGPDEFYALEAAVMAASTHAGWVIRPSHPAKLEAASRLQRQHGLPDIASLLRKLNAARKAAAYGDVEFPDLNAEDVARDLEAYIHRAEEFVGGGRR